MNWSDSGHFRTDSLESAAKRYKSLGFSIIPLQGARNPQQPKLPLVKWSRYQHTQPTDNEIVHWFAGKSDLGIGIVCGRVSQLLVLDIDDASVASEFRHQLPHLANTYTVKSGTRGLPHFYFRLPAGWLVPTTSYVGADLRGEGSYVVAPPTRVGDLCWQVEHFAPIQTLTNIGLKQLLKFLTVLQVGQKSKLPGLAVDTLVASEFRRLNADEGLVDLYKRLARTGRNTALFKVAVMARDEGVSQADALSLLLPVHIAEQGDRCESAQARHREAVQTLASVYSRPARVQQIAIQRGLDTAVREKLLQEGLVAVGRVLDALYVANVPNKAMLTEAQICQIVHQYGIGRRSVMSALGAKYDENFVFEHVISPHIPPEYANAASHTANLNNSCEMSRGAKRVNNRQRGRPPKIYEIPEPQAVAKLLGITKRGRDVVHESELASPRAYRQALHDRLIARRPGAYPREWLAARLGVSRWTTRRYEAGMSVQVRPAFAEQVLTWNLASSLPTDSRDAAYGVFIEVSNGKRYPALRGIGLRLLKQGFKPILKHQQVNHYAPKAVGVGIPTPQVAWSDVFHESNMQMPPIVSSSLDLSVGIPTAEAITEDQDRPVTNDRNVRFLNTSDECIQRDSVGIPTRPEEPTFWLCPDCLDFHISTSPPTHCVTCDTVSAWEVVPPLIWRDAQALKSWWHTRQQQYRQTTRQSQLPDQPSMPKLSAVDEAWVGNLQAAVKGLSFTNARKLVQQFGVRVVEKAMAMLQQHDKVRSPAGFLISILRSENKLLLKNNKISDNKANPKAAMDWLRRLAQSEYLSFIANAEDILRWQQEGEYILATS